jgi:hypothetical protein
MTLWLHRHEQHKKHRQPQRISPARREVILQHNLDEANANREKGGTQTGSEKPFEEGGERIHDRFGLELLHRGEDVSGAVHAERVTGDFSDVA